MRLLPHMKAVLREQFAMTSCEKAPLRFVLHVAEGDATKGSYQADGCHLETLGTYTALP